MPHGICKKKKRFFDLPIQFCIFSGGSASMAVPLYLHLLPENSYTTVCPQVRGDNPRALVSGLSAVQVDKLLYN